MQLKERNGTWYVHFRKRRPDGKYQRFRVSTRETVPCGPDGKRVKEGSRLYEECRRLAWQRAIDIAEQGASKSDTPKGITIGDAVLALVEEHQVKGSSRATIEIFWDKLPRLLDYFGKTRDISMITGDDLMKYAANGLKARKPGSVDKELRTLLQAMDAVKVTRPKKPKLGNIHDARERFLEDIAEAKLLAKHVWPSKVDHVWMYILLGLTYSELYRIRPQDMDWEAKEVLVLGTKTDYRQRRLPMPPKVQEILRRRMRWLNGEERRPAVRRKGPRRNTGLFDYISNSAIAT